MLVVMKAQATPEQIQAVCDHIVQLGFRAHPLPGAQRTAIGITGNKGEVDRGNLEELSGVAEVIRVSKPIQTRQPGRQRRRHRHPLCWNRRHHRRPQPGHRGRPLLHRKPRAGLCDCRTGSRGRRTVLPRRRVQAPHLPLCFSRPRPGSSANHGGDPRALWVAHRDRSPGHRIARSGFRVGRRRPDRRTQHAELFAAQARRQAAQAGADQARPLGHPRRVPDGRPST